MAKQTKRAHKARTPKPVEVDGHLLPRSLYERLQNADAQHTRMDALNEMLFPHRPSGRAEKVCSDLFVLLNTMSVAIGRAGNYPFSTTHGAVREAGCQVLHSLAYELHAASVKLQLICDAIRAEDGEKFQDWQWRLAQIEGTD